MIALLLLSIVPQDVTTAERVDCTEVNKFHAEDGRLVFVQVIFWRRQYGSGEQMHVAGWKLADKVPGIKPVGNESVFVDGNHLRHVTAGTVLHTTTQYDPEQCDLEFWPKGWRIGLIGEVTVPWNGFP